VRPHNNHKKGETTKFLVRLPFLVVINLIIKYFSRSFLGCCCCCLFVVVVAVVVVGIGPVKQNKKKVSWSIKIMLRRLESKCSQAEMNYQRNVLVMRGNKK